MIDAARETGRSLAAAYCNRGFVLTEKRDLDRALTDLDKAIESDPTYPCSFSNRGRVFALKGDFNRAIAEYDAAIKLDPKFAIAYNNRGDAFLHRNELGRAIADFSTAIGLDPQNARTYGNRGVGLRAQPRLQKGARRLRNGHQVEIRTIRSVTSTAAMSFARWRTSAALRPITVRPSALRQTMRVAGGTAASFD